MLRLKEALPRVRSVRHPEPQTSAAVLETPVTSGTLQMGLVSMTPSSLRGALKGDLDSLLSSLWAFPMLCPLPGAVCVLVPGYLLLILELYQLKLAAPEAFSCGYPTAPLTWVTAKSCRSRNSLPPLLGISRTGTTLCSTL